MKYLFDTSVLVPALIKTLPAHANALAWLEKVHQQKIKAVISTHTLAELYCNLSRFPTTPKISPAAAKQLIDDSVLAFFGLISLDETDYVSLVNHLVAEQIIGAATYDALHVYAGIKANVDYILSFNARDFQRVYPAVAHKVIVP
jgi:predicted nucleic acid-binding protein